MWCRSNLKGEETPPLLILLPIGNSILGVKMKRFVLLAALAIPVFAQSRLRIEQLKVPEVSQNSILVVVQIDGKWQIKPLAIGQNVVIDINAGTIDSKYINQGASFQTDFFKLTQTDDGFNLSAIPLEPTLATMTVILNTAVLAEGEDYQVDGPNKLVRILPEKHPTKAGDIVQIKYMKKFL